MLSSKETSRVEIPFLGVIDTNSLRVEASVRQIVGREIDRKRQEEILLSNAKAMREKFSIAQNCVCHWLDRQQENKERNTATGNDCQRENRFEERFGRLDL